MYYNEEIWFVIISFNKSNLYLKKIPSLNSFQNFFVDDIPDLESNSDSDDELQALQGHNHFPDFSMCLKHSRQKKKHVSFMRYTSPLFTAVKHEDNEGIQDLISQGAKVQSLLEEAVAKDDIQVLEKSVKLGAQIKDNLLFHAIHHSKIALKWLIAYGLNVNTVSSKGQSLLEIAICNNNTMAVTDLLSAGADSNALVHYLECDNKPVIIASLFDNPTIMDLLIKSGAAVNYINRYGDTPLMISAHRSDQKTVELLLKAGAEVNTRGWEDRTALILAMYDGDHCITELLLTAGAEVNAENCFGETSLALAVRYNHNKTALALIYAGASVKDTDLTEHPRLKIAHELCNKLALSLKHLSREAIRKCILRQNIGSTISELVTTLPLPNILKQYVIDKNRLCDY